MLIRSPGLVTDLVLARWSGEVLEHADHVVVRHPDAPDFWSGNAIVVAATGVDLEAWQAWFAAAHPTAAHAAIHVDGEVSADLAAAATAAGFEVRRSLALAAAADARWVQGPAPAIRAPLATAGDDGAAPAPPDQPVVLRPLAGDDDWDARLLLALACDELEAPRDDVYRTFIADRHAVRRGWAEAGRGAWWGAFAGDRLVASLGLYAASGGERLARYQDVVTHPDHRRRGLATALLAAAARAEVARGRADTLVIVADEGGDAARLYARVGFAPAGVFTELLRRPAGAARS